MGHKIYLHIGFGKTGSSSLQSYLSFNSVHQSTKEKILYCCLEQDGNVLHGKQLLERARNRVVNYLTSICDVTKIPDLNKTKEQISQLVDAGYTPFFSQEDWGRRGGEFANTDFFNKIGCQAHVIAYVRPQVPWFNSGWWQWYAWGDNFSAPEDVINKWGYHFMSWGKMIARWSKVPGVERIIVRLHSKDIVKDCMNTLGVFSLAKQSAQTNVSLSPMLIKILRQFPELRSQQSSYVDFILAKKMNFTGKPPWVITQNLAQNIVYNTRKSNLALMKYMDEASQEIMRRDSHWWDGNAYSTNKVWSDDDLLLKPEECEELLRQISTEKSKLQKLASNSPGQQSKDCMGLLGQAMSSMITKGRQGGL